jgi:hypothetical protein
MNGNVTIVCRNCGHLHHRYVVNGEITHDRWKSGGATVSDRILTKIKDADSFNQVAGQGQAKMIVRQSWLDRFGV